MSCISYKNFQETPPFHEEDTVSNNKLTSEQVDQLVEAAAKEPLSSWTALSTGPRFSAEQQQRLVCGAARSAVFAAAVLTDVPWLTETQKGLLSRAAS